MRPCTHGDRAGRAVERGLDDVNKAEVMNREMEIGHQYGGHRAEKWYKKWYKRDVEAATPAASD